jgi:acyl carrier protein
MSGGVDAGQVRRAIARLLHVPVERVVDDQPLAQLVPESLLRVRLALDLEEVLGISIPMEELGRIETVGELVRGFVR